MSRITRADSLVLSTGIPDARITKQAVLVLSLPSYPVYLTKIATMALVGPSDCLTQFCQCWVIIRTDGQTFAYTTHNEEIYFNGYTFSPCYSITASATEAGIITKRGIGDVELTGAMHEDGITEHDIVNGKFDNAMVDGYLVGWSATSRPSSRRLLRGVIGKSKHKKTEYEFEVLTFGTKLEQNTMQEVYKPSCRFELGVAPCPINIASFAVNGSVTNITEANGLNRTKFRQFYDNTLTQAANYFTLGKITWNTGLNTGISSEIKGYDNTTDLVTLWNATPYEIQIGDTYTMLPGCNKSQNDHTVKFGLPPSSFGGFPDVPGQDAISRTPNAR